MWNDTDIPLAYLITFRCYGTWLHGDKRGSTNRFRNGFGSSPLPANQDWLQTNTGRMKRDPVKLNAKQRLCIENTIRETCRVLEWGLFAINVRTNHIHVVVSAGDRKAEGVLNALKSYSTRDMRKAGIWRATESPWSDKGSVRRLWNEKHILDAVEYVIDGQGGPLPEFD